MAQQRARPPKRLVGVGFSAQGAFEATYFRRSEASRRPEVSWIFEGIDDEAFGNYGLSAGGAAGFELGRADVGFGTPAGAVILATSENPPRSFFTAMEELLGPKLTLDGGTDPDSLIRSDMIYFELDGGGAVFAAGSITFCGSLWNGAFDGPISKLLQNVVERLSSHAFPSAQGRATSTDPADPRT